LTVGEKNYPTHLSFGRTEFRRGIQDWVEKGNPTPTAKQIANLSGVYPHVTIEAQGADNTENPHYYLYAPPSSGTPAGKWAKQENPSNAAAFGPNTAAQRQALVRQAIDPLR
jgi:hypothetical protein